MTTLTLSKKQAISLQEATHRYNIWVGAVRSGKSFASLLKFEDFCKNGPTGDFIILGKSRDTIKRNVLYPLRHLLGERFRFYLGRAEATLYNRIIHIVGCNDERAAHKIQGSTLAGAYVDEIATIPEEVFQMLKSRLSLPGAQMFGTTNPDSPFHWLKKNFIDKAGELDIKYWNFRLEDNPSLDPLFVTNIKKEYVGLWYQRYIEGEWVLAEGTIFDFFDKQKHVMDFPPGAAEYYVCGVDYGTTNPTAFSLIGYSSKTFPNRWLEKEYYWDSKIKLRQKTDTEYAEDLKKFLQGYNVRTIYIDPSAVSFRVELQRMGFSGIIEAENEVLDGIRYHSLVLSNGTFKICHNCIKTIEEYSTYRWDEKASQRGEDKPRKENDHCFAAKTLIATPFGNEPIESIKVGDFVFTRKGAKRVLAIWESEEEKELINVNGTIVTPNHPYVTKNRGVVSAFELTKSDILFKIDPICWDLWKKKQLFGMEKNITDIQKPKIIQSESILDHIDSTCIERFGNFTMDQFQKDIISTIETKIPQTIQSTISNSYQLKIMLENIMMKKENFKQESTLIQSDILPKNGIDLKKEKNGIKEMVIMHGTWSKINLENANNVEANIPSKLFMEKQNSALMHVNQHGEEIQISIKSLEIANIAENNFIQQNIITLPHVLSVAPQNLDGRKEKVYNLTIEDDHEYFADGILVLNCMDSIRYALFTEWFKKEGPRMKAEDVQQLKDEVYGAIDGGQGHGKFFDDKMW